MDINNVKSDSAYINALDNIIENKTIFQRVLFSDDGWNSVFMDRINESNWVTVDSVNGIAPLNIVIRVTNEKNSTPMHIINLIISTIIGLIMDTDGKPTVFGGRLINAKADYAPYTSYIDRYNWLKEYCTNPTALSPMFNVLPLMDGMYDIRF